MNRSSSFICDFSSKQNEQYDGAISFCDLTNSETLSEVMRMEQLYQDNIPSSPLIRVGNKVDVRHYKGSSPFPVNELRNNCVACYMISVKGNLNIQMPILDLLRRITNKSDLVFVEAPAIAPPNSYNTGRFIR